MDFLGKIKNIDVSPENIVDITISTDNDTILEELEKFLKSQKNMSIEIKRLYNRRSLDANAYFHFLVNKLARFYKTSDNEMKIKDDLERGEQFAEIEDKVSSSDKLSARNRRMLIFILIAEFFWFMADNGIGTFMGNYTVYHLKAATSSNAVNTLIGGLGSVLGFALGGIIASKIGRKYTVVSGLSLSLFSYIVWLILTFTILKDAAGGGKFPVAIYIIWFFKGLGMSLVHVNSFPMVVELCSHKSIGRFTGYYYASSMAAQTITPIALGSLMLLPSIDFGYLPVYASTCLIISLVTFMFVANVKTRKTKIAKGLEAFDQED